MLHKGVDLTQEGQFKTALLAEADLSRLKRQYILMDHNRRQTLTCRHDFALQKQKIVCAIFQKEHEEMLNNLMVAKCSTKAQEDKKNSEKIANLLIEYDYYSEAVNAKHKFITEIEGQIKIVKKQFIDVQSKMVTDRGYEDKIKYFTIVLEKLENKLELQMRKFGEICWDNRRMRDEIDHMMHERSSFLSVWKKLIKKLVMGKKFMMDLIEQATIAYNQREEWCQKLQTLRMKAHQDVLHHGDRMRAYVRCQDNAQNIQNFIGVKGQKRLMLDLAEKKRLRREERLQNCRETLLKNHEILVTIMEFTMEGSVSTICKNFIREEQYNFMNLVFINDLIAELEVIGDRLGYLHEEIDTKRTLHENRLDQQGYRIEEVQEELQLARKECNESQVQLKQSDDALATMIAGINRMIHIVRCNTDPMLELLGKNTYIHEYNVLLFLESLERRVHDLIIKLTHKEKTKKGRTSHESVVQQKSDEDQHGQPILHLIDHYVESNPCPLCVEHEYASVDVGIDSKPRKVWDKDEVKYKLSRRLELPDGLLRIHNVSKCLLPKSREIIQKRYQ